MTPTLLKKHRNNI